MLYRKAGRVTGAYVQNIGLGKKSCLSPVFFFAGGNEMFEPRVHQGIHTVVRYLD